MAAVEANRVEVENDEGETEYLWHDTPTIRFTGSFDCTECRDFECEYSCPDCGGVCDDCWRPQMGEHVVLTDEFGVTITDAHSIAVTFVAGRYLWVVHRGSSLSWGWLDESSGSSAAEASLGFDPSTVPYETPLALATETSDRVVLAYRQEDGTVMIAKGTPLGGGLDWTSAEPALDTNGQPLQVAPDTAVGLAVADARLILSVPTEVPISDEESTSRVELFDASADGIAWMPLAVIDAPTKGAAQLAYTGYPSGNRLIVSMQAPDLMPLRSESFPGDLSTYTPAVEPATYAVAFPIPIVWDARTGLLPGLRAWYAETLCTPGTCGDGLSCLTAGGAAGTASNRNKNQCRPVVSGELGPQVEAQQFLIPFHDGVLPVNFYDMDDRPHMRQDYCTVLRTCDDVGAYGGVCIPSEGQELDPSGVPYGAALCAPTPSIESTHPACGPIWPPD